MNIHIVIPARYNSSRLIGKPLLEINDKPVIYHVYKNALKVGFKSVVIATEEMLVLNCVDKFGADCLITSDTHESGTDRIAEVARIKKWDENDIIVNLQGDEPQLSAKYIRKVADLLSSSEYADIATLAAPINDVTTLLNPNVVKVVLNKDYNALYFSRSPIPWNRDSFSLESMTLCGSDKYLRHIGLYAYRVKTLTVLCHYPVSPLENLEKLEQLRALENGMSIKVGIIDTMPPHGIDTQEDYLRVKKIMESKNGPQ